MLKDGIYDKEDAVASSKSDNSKSEQKQRHHMLDSIRDSNTNQELANFGSDNQTIYLTNMRTPNKASVVAGGKRESEMTFLNVDLESVQGSSTVHKPFINKLRDSLEGSSTNPTGTFDLARKSRPLKTPNPASIKTLPIQQQMRTSIKKE